MGELARSLNLSPLQLLILVAVFGLTLSLWLIGVMVWAMKSNRRQQQLNRRLGIELPGDAPQREIYLWVDGKLASTSVPITAPQRLHTKLQLLAEKAGWNTSPGAMLLVGVAVMALGGGAALLWSHSLMVAGVSALCVGYGLMAYTERCIANQQTRFENQMVDALGLATRSLRAGHPLIGAFQLIAQEMEPPLSHIFAEICQKQELGKSLEDALAGTVSRTNSHDLKFFATAVIIQMRSGGNLADMMERLTLVVRERMRLARRARVLTAESKMSKNVLIALPFVMFLLLSFISPDFTAKLTDTSLGRMMLGAAVVSMMLGAWIMNKLSILRY
jgi:tight adherence protein B